MGKPLTQAADTVFPGAGSLAGSAGSAASDYLVPKAPAVAPPPVAPGDPANEAARAERDAAAEEIRKRSAFGRAYTNPLGGVGDTSQPNLAAKTLLGT